jgi:hypothetical protein
MNEIVNKPFITHNDDDLIKAHGTGLQARLHNLTYATIVDTFGEPSEHFDDYKSDAEGVIHFIDGLVATLYNYKNGRNYNGPDAPSKYDITTWNVGGNNHEVVLRLRQLLMKDPTHHV